MTTFDDRDKSFEKKYAHDEELAFKANARRNKLLGQWAAAKLGKTGEEAAQYARETVEADFERDGPEDVVEKLLKDFTDAGLAVSASDIRVEMERLLPVAKNQIMSEVK